MPMGSRAGGCRSLTKPDRTSNYQIKSHSHAGSALSRALAEYQRVTWMVWCIYLLSEGRGDESPRYQGGLPSS